MPPLRPCPKCKRKVGDKHKIPFHQSWYCSMKVRKVKGPKRSYLNKPTLQNKIDALSEALPQEEIKEEIDIFTCVDL